VANILVFAPALVNSGQELVDVLNAAGHTATLDTVPPIDTGFDVLITQHGTSVTLSQVQAYIDAGKPVIVVDSANGTGRVDGNTTDANHVLLGLELANAYTRDRYYQEIYSLSSTHFLTQGLSSPLNYLNSGGTAQGVLDLPLLNGGALVPILGYGDQTPNPSLDEGYDIASGAALVAFEKGLLYTKSGVGLTELPVRVAWFAGGAPTTGNGSPTGYSTAGETLVARLVNWVLGLSTAVDPIAVFTGYPAGLTLNLTDGSVAIAPGATIVKWFWSFDGGAQTSLAINPTFVAPSTGTYQVTLVVWDSNGNSNQYSQSFTFGAGSSVPPYDLPTTKVAGRFLIKLDSTIDWTGITGVVEDTSGGFWLNYYKLPKSGGGTEPRVRSVDVSDGADQPVRTLRASLILGGAAGSISSGAVDSYLNTLSGSYSPVIFGGREILVQVPLGSEDSTDPDDWEPRFHGFIDRHPASSDGEVRIEARDVASRLQIPYKGAPVWIGTEGSDIAIADAIQAVLDAATRTGLWALNVPDELDFAFPAFQLPQSDNVLDTINEMARQRGAVVRWWPDVGVYATNRFQLSLFVLQEEKGSPDYTYGPNGTKDVPEHDSDVTNVRNDITLQFVPAGATEPVTLRRPATQEEIDAFGLKSLIIGTDQTKHITNSAAANVMLDYIDDAVRLPATIGARIISPANSQIEINSLLRFTPDTRISTENVDLYVTAWAERWEAAGESIETSITVSLRGAPAGQIRAWLRRLAGLESTIVTPKLPPTWEYLTRVTYNGPSLGTYTGTVWWKLTTHGLAVIETRAQTKEPASAWSLFGPPDRAAGDMSVVHGRVLAIGEYEKDVPVDSGGAFSSIRGEVTVQEIANPITLFEVNIDADNDPEIIDVNPIGLDAEVIADDDTLSVHIVKVSGPGSAYSASFDSNVHTFAVPVPAAGTWELEATAKNTLIADPEDKVSEPFPFSISNTGEPTISLLVEAPDDGSGVMTIEATATSSPAGYRARYWMKYQTTPLGGGGGFTSSETDITPMMSPSPFVGGLPTTPTTYEFSTNFVRNDADPEGTIAVEIRAEILDEDGIVVSDTGPYPFVEPWAYRIPT
jgi:hypothetical protein